MPYRMIRGKGRIFLHVDELDRYSSTVLSDVVRMRLYWAVHDVETIGCRVRAQAPSTSVFVYSEQSVVLGRPSVRTRYIAGPDIPLRSTQPNPSDTGTRK